MAKKKSGLKLKEKKEDSAKIDLVHERPNDYFSFNWSFITNYKKYGLEKLDNIKLANLVKKIHLLSKRKKIEVLALPKNSGMELLKSKNLKNNQLKHDIVKDEFRDSHRYKRCGEDYWIFRLGTDGRVITKKDDNIVYIMAVDTDFDLYDH